jgi:membrane protein DedA with SNARE-associated domain
MTPGDMSNQISVRVMRTLRSGRTMSSIGVGLAIVAAVVLMAIWEGDVPELFQDTFQGLRSFFMQHTYLPGFGLLYIEESGIPLPAPGDVFVMYVGVHIPRDVWAFLAAWLGLILVVVLGATNLYLVSRRYGTRLVQSQFAEYVHLSPERLEKAEQWFKRYGVLAIIFGRHIPGFRVPITVASGVFRVPYRVFAPCVAVSSAIWAGVMLTLGVTIGPRLAVLLRAHGEVYFIWAGLVVVLVVGMYLRQRRLNAEAGRRGRADRQVESPSS